MGIINDQVPLMYEEPHPLTEPEAIKMVIINMEKRFFHQRKRGQRGTSEDSMNFNPWARTSDSSFEIQEFIKFQGDDPIKVANLDELLSDEEHQVTVSHRWLLQWINILNGSMMTPGNPGFKGFNSKHKLKNHWDSYWKLRNKAGFQNDN